MTDRGLVEKAEEEHVKESSSMKRGTALTWIFLTFLLYMYDIGWLEGFLKLKWLFWLFRWIGNLIVGLFGGSIAVNANSPMDSLFSIQTGFNGFDPQQFLAVFGALSQWENLSRILLNVFVLATVSVYVATKIGKKGFDPKELVSTALLIVTASFFMSMGILRFSVPHAAFVLLFYFFIRKYFDDGFRSNLIFIGLLILDYVGYGLLHYYVPDIGINRFILPIWLYVALIISQRKVESALITFLLAALILFTVVNFAQDVIAFDVGSADITTEQGEAAAIEQGKTFAEKVSEGLQLQLEYATGGYYKGRVEENVNEPLGVYFENIRAASPRFYTDESAEVWGTLTTKTLDQDEPVNLSVTCKTKEKIPGMVNTLPEAKFKIYTAEEEAVSCKFKPGDLGKGTHEIELNAKFNFKTLAFLKSYFMDRERLRSLRRENIDPLKQYGITERNPVALFTNGPVRIGMETNVPPIGISSDEPSNPYLGITVENQWNGQVSEIKELIVQIPKSMEFIDNCDNRFDLIQPRTLDDNDYNTYILNDIGRRAFKTPIGGEDSDVNLQYRSIRCLMRIPNVEDVLGQTPVATHFFRTSVTYDYELKEKIKVNVYLPPGVEEEIGIAGYCSGADLSRLNESVLKVCKPYLADFGSVREEMRYKDRIDLLMLMSVAYQESGCNPKIYNGGIMQVHGKTYTNADTVRTQIKDGADILDIKYTIVEGKDRELNAGLNELNKLRMALLAYNRGEAVSNRAIYWVTKNVPFFTAMQTACEETYDGSTPQRPKTDSKGNNMCTYQGYGPNYPVKIIEIYDNACRAMSGARQAGLPLSPGEAVVAVDAGHGVESGGGEAIDGTKEGEITWQLAKELISSLGSNSFQTRTVPDNLEFTPRIDAVMAGSANMVVSIHVDNTADGKERDCSNNNMWVIYNTGTVNEQNSLNLAGSIAASLRREFPGTPAEVRTEDITIHDSLSILTGNQRLGYPTAVLIEVGYICNPGTRANLKAPEFRARLVSAIKNGIYDYVRPSFA